MKHQRLPLAITALSLAAVLVSVVTSDVQAAEVETAALADSTALVSIPTLPVLMMVLQKQYVLDPTGLVYPTHPCPYFIGPEETAEQGALLDVDAAHLLD